ncbi:MAG: hypothetical protein ACM3WS_06395, partial [Bacillota bacterium]
PYIRLSGVRAGRDCRWLIGIGLRAISVASMHERANEDDTIQYTAKQASQVHRSPLMDFCFRKMHSDEMRVGTGYV